MESILEVRNLVRQFGKLTAVNNLSLSIPAGSCFGLLGPNGAGKTTTVEIMEGIQQPDGGQVLYRGQPLDDDFRQKAGIMFQTTALQEHITVMETLRMFSRLYDTTVSLQTLIENFSLQEFLGRDTRKLSGGQKQRLLLAIALINNPDVVFLDEPSTGLDPQARRNIWKTIQDIKASGKTIILTTHYMEEAHELCDDLAIIDKGEIVAQGSPEALLNAHFNDVVLQLPLADIPENSGTFSPQAYEQKDHLFIITSDVEEEIKQLQSLNIPLQHLRIRSRNLEDLFLQITGKELRA